MIAQATSMGIGQQGLTLKEKGKINSTCKVGGGFHKSCCVVYVAL